MRRWYKFYLFLGVVLLLGYGAITTGEIANSHLFSTSSINTSGNLNEKSETTHYSSYAGGSACCPTGRSCEFDSDYGGCICNPSEYDPHCMYDGCEEITVKGRKMCSCPCKGYIPIVQEKNPIPQFQPTPTVQPLKTKEMVRKETITDQAKEIEPPYAILKVTIFNGPSILYNSEMSSRNITIQPGATVKMLFESLESNVPGYLAILEDGKIIADKYVTAEKTNKLTFSYQALHDKEMTFTFFSNDDDVISEDKVIIHVEKILPKNSNIDNKPIETTPQSTDFQGSIAVISSSKNSVVNN